MIERAKSLELARDSTFDRLRVSPKSYVLLLGRPYPLSDAL